MTTKTRNLAADGADRMQQAVLTWMDAQDRGTPLSPDVLVHQYPDIAEELRDFLTTEQRLADTAGGGTESVAGPAGTEDNYAACRATAHDERLIRPDAGGPGIGLPRDALAPEFELLDVVARGGMGIVYKARRIALDRIVALKLILLGDWATPDVRQRFQRESRTLAQLRHPSIVTVYSAGEVRGRSYLEMEFVDGNSLQHVIADGPVSPHEAARIVEQVAEGVQEAHAQNILHRDLKPSNILIDVDGHPRVTDFGLAKVMGERDDLTVTGQIVGTPCYMSPEQAGGQSEVNRAADIYGLGAVLYATITGGPPFRTDIALWGQPISRKSSPGRNSTRGSLKLFCNRVNSSSPTSSCSSLGVGNPCCDEVRMVSVLGTTLPMSAS